MTIQENTFAEACYNNNSIDELQQALKNGPDSEDMRVWGLSESEWTHEITIALVTLANESPEAKEEMIFS